MKAFIESEVKIINKMFQHNQIKAKVVKAENVLGSFVRYHLSLHASQSFSAIEKVQRELSALIVKNRVKVGIDPTDIILSTKPGFSLEVAHPSPKPLFWPMYKLLNLKQETMLAGVSAVDNKPELIEFSKVPHVLVAGMTNAGKSVLLQMLLLSLAANNKPEDLGFVLIDLKNEDLTPFKSLPHVVSYNYDFQSAVTAIDFMLEEKKKRIEENKGRRLILVIDELAQLANDRKVAAKLGDLASIGRSKRLNLIAATQSVTKDGGIGSMMKANFSCRLIGKVPPGMSSIATGLAKMQAHLLPGFGSFLRIEGNNNHRFQSYYIDQSDVKLMVEHIKQQTMQAVLPGVETGFTDENHQIYTSNNETQQKTSLFPIGYFREFTETEVEEIKRISLLPEYQYQGRPSLNKIVVLVFGSKDPKKLDAIKKVLK